MSIALSLFAIWTRAIVLEHRRVAAQQNRLQAVRLAEAGVRRAIALRAENPRYNEETWTVSPQELGGKHAAEVRIRVIPDAESGTLRFKATAEYPQGATRRVQVTRKIGLPEIPTGTE
jgi:hypothetical protein